MSGACGVGGMCVFLSGFPPCGITAVGSAAPPFAFSPRVRCLAFSISSVVSSLTVARPSSIPSMSTAALISPSSSASSVGAPPGDVRPFRDCVRLSLV